MTTCPIGIDHCVTRSSAVIDFSDDAGQLKNVRLDRRSPVSVLTLLVTLILLIELDRCARAWVPPKRELGTEQI